MVHSTKKIFGLLLMASMITVCAYTPAIAKVEDQPTQQNLQPQVLDYTGVYTLRKLDPDLTGSGVKFAVICRSINYLDGEPQNDYRPDTKHNCFADKRFNFHNRPELQPEISPHSTAICSILFGTDTDGFNRQLGRFSYQGIVPQAQADIYEFWHFLINNVFPHSPPNADIVTASIGSQFEDWWTRGIESLVEQYGLIVVAGAGNGSSASDPLLYPGAAANVIGVGVVDSVNTEDLATNLANFSLAYPGHSSFGPTADSRCKPDIVAPGNCLTAELSEPNRYAPTGNWSSFSTPVVAGTLGLLAQKAKQQPDLAQALSPKAGNCVMKAILLNSATKLPYWHKGRLEKEDDHQAPLDYIQGAGMVNAVSAYKHLIAGQNRPGDVSTIGWDINQLQKSENTEHIYKITVGQPADNFITTTVAFNRHYETVYPFEPMPEKDADLRLELWAVDQENRDNDYLLDYSDSITDNLEHIYCRADPNYTNYEIIVSYSSIQDQNQPDTAHRYGLAWNVSELKNTKSIFWYDLNADGIVNELDFTVLFNNLLAGSKSTDSYLLGDINTDGVIDVNDLHILLSHNNLKADWYTE